MGNRENSCEMKILLKARPTAGQLADRFNPEPFDGLELYMDAADLSGEDWLTRLEEAFAVARPPEGLHYVVEGPLRSLDGRFFSIAEDVAANRETLRRLVQAGRRLGAAAAVIHAVAPLESPELLSNEARRRALEASLPLLRFYEGLCRDAGLVPTIENIPPVAQQRERRVMASALGVTGRDMRALLRAVPGLRCTVDTSHAQLYVNMLVWPAGERDERLAAAVRYYKDVGEQLDLAGYIELLAPWLVHAHVSNATGLMGEGLPYDGGDVDLDPIVRRLARTVQSIVPEILEPDPARCPHMRAGARAIRRALSGVAVGAP
jgi:sugar phosphate isomerase/epimerase